MTDEKIIVDEEQERLVKERARQKRWRDANKDKDRAKQKKWRDANKEKTKERNRKYREANKDNAEYQKSKKAAHRRWSEANREMLRQRSVQYRKDNAEQIGEYKKQYHKLNREKINRYRKQYGLLKKDEERWLGYRLRKRYGLTVDEYKKLYEQQNGLCAICKQPETRQVRGNVCLLAVDHDHNNGKVRGLLCHICNTSLGGFRDNVDYLQAAIGYLNQSRDTNDSPTFPKRLEKAESATDGPLFVGITTSSLESK